MLLYPVLQTADILLYKAQEVPVGEDQTAHLNLARDLAHKFNVKYGQVFPEIRPIYSTHLTASRIKNLRDPSKKMSKSDLDVKGRIDISDSPEVIREKCKKALTDFTSAVTFDPVQRPGVSNLISLHSLFTQKSTQTICDEASSLTTAQYKLVLADVIIEALAPIRTKIDQLMKEELFLKETLSKGAAKANEMASSTLQQVFKCIGFN